jgi:hypothetical protein
MIQSFLEVKLPNWPRCECSPDSFLPSFESIRLWILAESLETVSLLAEKGRLCLPLVASSFVGGSYSVEGWPTI